MFARLSGTMIAVAMVITALAASPERVSAEDGKIASAQAALASCAGCHDLSAARNDLMGAPLYDLFGRKPAAAGVPFDQWDAKTLDAWLAGPTKVKSDSSMLYSIKNPKKRAEIIEALRTLR